MHILLLIGRTRMAVHYEIGKGSGVRTALVGRSFRTCSADRIIFKCVKKKKKVLPSKHTNATNMLRNIRIGVRDYYPITAITTVAI